MEFVLGMLVYLVLSLFTGLVVGPLLGEAAETQLRFV